MLKIGETVWTVGEKEGVHKDANGDSNVVLSSKLHSQM